MTKLTPRIIFAGTPEFAAIHLQALLDENIPIHSVYTQPDKPAGRGQHLQSSPVKQVAKHSGIPVHQPVSLKSIEETQFLKNLHPDLMIVVAYGLILPPDILAIPQKGAINVHASLLPRWRGAAPIQRAILAGDEKTGISIMQMEAGLDTGPVFIKVVCPLLANDTNLQLHQKLALLGSKTLINCLPQILAGSLKAEAQDAAQATYAHKIIKQEAKINWQQSAVEIERRIRAFNPWPIAFTSIDNQVIRIWQATVVKTGSPPFQPGTLVTVSTQGIDVVTGDGIIRLLQLQREGGKPLFIKDILNAKNHSFKLGKILDSAAVDSPDKDKTFL